MNSKYKLLIVLVLLVFSTATYAQQEIEKMIQILVAKKVSQMCDYIELMANPENGYDIRNMYKEKAMRLFVANCEPYEEEGIQRKGVEMEITSTLRKKTRRHLMKDYFTGLMNMRYSKVQIKSSDIYDIQLSDLMKIDDNTFVCTAAFIQVFIGYRDGRPIYSDRTKKSVKCYVYKDEMIDGYEYIFKLGDTKALEIIKL